MFDLEIIQANSVVVSVFRCVRNLKGAMAFLNMF